MALKNHFTDYVPQISPAAIPQRSAYESHGVRMAHLQQTVNIVNGDDILSTYTLFKCVPAEAVLKLLEIETDAFTGVNIRIGLYDSDTGVLVGAANSLANALSINAAASKQVPLDGLNAVTHDNTRKCLFEHAGETLAKHRAYYDIVMQLNVASPANGKITARAELLPAG